MTFDELEAAGFVENHRCAICNAPVGYTIHPTFAAAVYSSGCGCSDGDTYRLLEREELRAIPVAKGLRNDL